MTRRVAVNNCHGTAMLYRLPPLAEDNTSLKTEGTLSASAGIDNPADLYFPMTHLVR
ncbi:hypothetical protein BDV39DRAFT_168692 [Aspergillus sergii]|uniref:Uncharacterized protein n=1 Tax=Aspergillus sergii TaxID=1034303 RepID=A0A5N6XDK3_9EURO|nr:hypothetical protein BDV39DRAFT_168692 [Aspergillus sergii]